MAPAKEMPMPNKLALAAIQPVNSAIGKSTSRPCPKMNVANIVPQYPRKIPTTVPKIPRIRLSRIKMPKSCPRVPPTARMIAICRRRSLTFIMNVLNTMKAASNVTKTTATLNPCSVGCSVCESTAVRPAGGSAFVPGGH